LDAQALRFGADAVPQEDFLLHPKRMGEAIKPRPLIYFFNNFFA
jgi:hypothetical protein